MALGWEMREPFYEGRDWQRRSLPWHKDLLDWRVPARYDRWYRLAHVNVNAFVHGKRLDRIVHVHRFFKRRCLGYIQHLDVGNFSRLRDRPGILVDGILVILFAREEVHAFLRGERARCNARFREGADPCWAKESGRRGGFDAIERWEGGRVLDGVNEGGRGEAVKVGVRDEDWAKWRCEDTVVRGREELKTGLMDEENRRSICCVVRRVNERVCMAISWGYIT